MEARSEVVATLPRQGHIRLMHDTPLVVLASDTRFATVMIDGDLKCAACLFFGNSVVEEPPGLVFHCTILC